MRKPFSKQTRFDCPKVTAVTLNLKCRDEIVPILRALQHVYSQAELRDKILHRIAEDVNAETLSDCGREGLDYWEILVLSSVRLGCNLDYDKLQDLAEQHRALRHVMGVGDWSDETNFSWRRIRDNVCLLRPETIEEISHLIVGAGHELSPDAVKRMRADSFVVETNIHYPAESSLMLDGVRVTLQLCVAFASRFELPGWRQHEHVLKRVKKLARNIGRISSKKGPNYKNRLKHPYRQLLKRTRRLLDRARGLCDELETLRLTAVELTQLERLKIFMERTEQVCDTARRRVLRGETVPNAEKLFSMFEPHTQLYKRGKAGEPVQFGRLTLIYEDAAGFIAHHHVMPRDAQDQDVVVEQTRLLQERLDGLIEEASFDRGFHTPENQKELAKIVDHVCLPKKGAKQAANQQATATVRFHQARQRHSGVESAIGALQSGNGLKRCRDRSESGFERYVALAILGRNLHTLGKLLIAQQDSDCEAAKSKRKQAA
jgi:IS5 family transposase